MSTSALPTARSADTTTDARSRHPEIAGLPTTTGTRPTAARRVDGSTYPSMARAYKEASTTVRSQGLLARTPVFYSLVGAALVLGFAACITAFVLLGDSWWQLGVAAVLGVLFTQVAFLAHEAAHRTILSSGPANDRLATALGAGVVGMSYSWWDSKHSRHHANPNRVDKDPDIAVDTISFLEEDAAQSRGFLRALTKRQGWLFFPLLTLEGINLHFLGLKHLCSPGRVKNRWLELSLITLRLAAVVVPVFVVLPVGLAFAFLAVQLAVFGVYMGASFAPNHKGMPIVDRAAKLDFFSKQVRTSRNIRGGWWATWLMGGLNYQIEHHLFPSMPRPHLAKARRIVKELCERENTPYTETSLVRSYAIVIDYLNRVGLAARDPFDCPMVSEFRRG
ncbi:fatty acid desaturase family protein [Brevibacterium samyangense]|uniref:Acyl-CoA desaturase n=1 Tax=Brevibacterium samyangense TaxID=366888 RepID=A0ABN2TLX8_9MICO